ncbi:MAG: sigma-70 family RNA polymerase sigma factor [Lachnospiraceae bacterium]|nr:sigma-70 family RNA polymerase sigma factor [Lachnospiraceae bacterium]
MPALFFIFLSKFIVTFSGLKSHIYEGGEKVDIEKLYQEYFSVVYKYILSMSRNSLTAEEITQETFFKAMKKIESFRGDCSVRVWLCQIAKNLYYDYLKNQSRFEELPEEYGESSLSPEEDIVRETDRNAIHRILHSLKEPYKEVFTLRTYGELSFSEIAELFEKTTSWARVTYHRARIMIKEEMNHGENNM